MNVSDIGGFFSQIYAVMVGLIDAKANEFVTDGIDLAAVLLLITLTLTLMMAVLTSGWAQAMADGLLSVMKFSFVAAMLVGWSFLVGPFFADFTNNVSTRISGSASVGEGAGQILSSIKAVLLGSAEQVVCANGSSADCEKAEIGLFEILTKLPQVLAIVLFRLLNVLLLCGMLAAYLLVNFGAEIMYGLTRIMGPLMIPFLIWKPTEWLFDSWLKATLGACFIKIVAAFLVLCVSGLIKGTTQLAVLANASVNGDLVSTDELIAAMLAVATLLGTLLMWQAPSLAQGLLSGSGGFTAGNIGRGAIGRTAAGLLK